MISPMNKIIILGSGAAPGVPSLSQGWGHCNPANAKNLRTRTTTYFNFNGAEILIDTSPDLRAQLLAGNIRNLDAVLYTHSHADHLHGIDDLREINRLKGQSLNIYAIEETMDDIKKRFSYLIVPPDCLQNVMKQPSLVANDLTHNQPIFIKGLKITPIKIIGHNASTTGYVFNDGEVVYIADFRAVDALGLQQIKVRPKLLILPLTLPVGDKFHASIEEVLFYIEKINPEQAIINHMATECDYEAIKALLPAHAIPAYDNMVIEF